jgi:hypothetical protein
MGGAPVHDDEVARLLGRQAAGALQRADALGHLQRDALRDERADLRAAAAAVLGRLARAEADRGRLLRRARARL